MQGRGEDVVARGRRAHAGGWRVGRRAHGRGPCGGAMRWLAVPRGGDKKLGFEFYADLIHPIVD